MEVELQEKVSETKRKLELEHEDEKRQLEESHRKETEAIENRYKDLIKTLENEISNYKNLQFDKDDAEAKMENLKLEVEVKDPFIQSFSHFLCRDLKLIMTFLMAFAITFKLSKKIMKRKSVNYDAKSRISKLDAVLFSNSS